ncbi:nuclear transport factor 2 family protein [Gemmobacter serpentinus]|uniref:nuclear transport factor 2 family protein n=1 Tax=Gemmobacter serpentinus TaxID=2652247 RepID=UPI001CF6E5A0|nr:nuclear transport factor 2 family protein [Gemmobacter serpentinus]
MEIKMAIILPNSIKAYFDADRDRSPEAVASAFTAGGIVKDKGKTHRGRDAIRDWMAAEEQQYDYTVTPFFIGTENGRTQVTAHAVGNFPGSPIDLRFFFVLEQDKIAELEITV